MVLRRLALTALLALPSTLLATEGPSADSVPPNRSFDAFIGDRPLGTHRYQFGRDGEALTLRSEAQFEFKLGFLTLFSYDHVAEERWTNGCLSRFESQTKQNSDRFEVAGRWEDGVLALETQDGVAEAASPTEAPITEALRQSPGGRGGPRHGAPADPESQGNRQAALLARAAGERWGEDPDEPQPQP